MTLGAKHQEVPVGNVPAILPKQPSRTPAQLLIPPVGARQPSIVNFWSHSINNTYQNLTLLIL